MSSTAPEAFKLDVGQDVLGELAWRLNHTRWPNRVPGAAWRAGTDHDYLRSLVRHWSSSYDWKAREVELNRLAHFKADVDGFGIHFVHERGKGPRPYPLLLTHGYPDSFLRFVKIIPMLTDPASFGGDPEDAFDVVVPDLPGYGFSDPPAEHGMIFRVHDAWAHLMTRTLGYEHFGAHGGDWGGTVTERLARSHPECVSAIHLTDVPFGHLFQKPSNPSRAEEAFFEDNEKWLQKDGAYALIQSTRPDSLAPAMNDSPAGLAAWMVEKFREWSDCNGDVESRFSKDELLTHVMIYWVTSSVGTSFLPYYDYANATAFTWMKEGAKKVFESSKVPAAIALFPKDISHAPREWAERFFNVKRWTQMARGGHFAAMEEPELLAEDLRTWFRAYR